MYLHQRHFIYKDDISIYITTLITPITSLHPHHKFNQIADVKNIVITVIAETNGPNKSVLCY